MQRNVVILLWLLALLALVVFIIAAIIGYYNYQANRRPEQAEFNKGKVKQYPDGVYSGTATVAIGNWLGKQFNAVNNTGINRFTDGNRYAFTTKIDQSLTDNREVFRIDYNQSANPWWLRMVTDEIVQVAPNEFLGKIQIHPVFGITLTYGYFRLNK